MKRQGAHERAARAARQRHYAVAERLRQQDLKIEAFRAERQRIWEARRNMQVEARRAVAEVKGEVAKQEATSRFRPQKPSKRPTSFCKVAFRHSPAMVDKMGWTSNAA